MHAFAFRRSSIALAALCLTVGCSTPRAVPADAVHPAGAVDRRGLILQASEGEHLVHRPPPGALSNLATPFIIKVDRRNGGSPDFVMFTEDIPPGKGISPHRHPESDEIIFVHGGTGLVTLDGRQGVVTTGGTIYMPRNTVVSLRNTGPEPLSIVSFFSRPGFDAYLREISVAEGQVATPLTVEELTAIRARHLAHAVYVQP